MSTRENTDPIAGEFMQLWAATAASLMGQITSGAFPISLTDQGPEGLGAAPTGIYLTITAAGAARGEMSFRVPAGVALQMAKAFSGDANAERTDLTSDDRSALDELFRQI